MKTTDPDRHEVLVERLFQPLQASVDMDYIGEPISQLGHALQCAHWANKQGADDEVILAALFHDVGHLIDASAPQMEGLGVINHEGLGRAFLEEHGCSERVGKLVEAHVQAKRYLCFKNPKYYARLSEASKGTLAWQGGPMSETEAAGFEANSDFKTILAIRSWDELAKDPELEVAPLDAYRPLLLNHLRTQGSTSC